MEIINRNKVKLIEWLCGEDFILQYVQSRKLVTNSEYEDIKSIQSPNKKVTELLDIILRKGNSTCIDFLKLLKEDEVNESRPELRRWINAVDTSALEDKTQNSNTPQPGTSNIQDYLPFLKRNKTKLIVQIKAVEGLVDYLTYLRDEQAAIVRAEPTDQAKMRKVLDYTTSKKAAKILVDALNEHDVNVMEELQ